MAANDLKLSPSGLWTAPSVIEAPRGGLAVAQDIVIRRTGMAEPRPGFSEDTSTFPVATLAVHRMLEREAADGTFDLLAVGTHSGAYMVWSNGIEIKNPVGTALTAWVRDRIWGINTRGNLYLTTATGPRRMSQHANVYAKAPKAGSRTYHVWAAIGGAGRAVLANQWVSYRVVRRTKDANGLTVRSGVSGRAVFQGTGTNQYANVNIVGQKALYDLEGGGSEDGAVIEVYRSENSLTYPPLDEHFYVGELAPASSADTALPGYAVFKDDVPDASLGVALYTNATEQGQDANHVTIPAAGCGAMFNGSLFLGNLSYPAGLVLAVPFNSAANFSSGVGVRAFTGTYTNGSATVAVADTTGLEVGQIIENVGGTEWGGGGYTRIISGIVNVSITLSAPYTGANGTKIRTVLDSVKINSQYFPVSPSSAGGLATFLVAAIRGYVITGFVPAGTVAGDLASTSVTANAIGIDKQDLSYFQIEQFEANQATPASFTIQATHGDQYTPALPNMAATPMTVSQEDVPNGIAWSNELEAEHFTGPNEDRIAPNGRIMAMHALGNALLVLMDTGLWRVSGSGAESGFRFDQLDQDMRLIHPYAACRLKDMVYAHGDKGIHECDENSAAVMTGLNLRDQLQPVQELAGAGSTTAYGFFAVTNRKADEICFSVPTVSALGVGDRLYVYNANTKAWTNWFSGRGLVCGIAKNAGALLDWFDTGVLRTERVSTSSPAYTVDKAGTATSTSSAGAAISFSGLSSGFSPQIGDLIQDPLHPTEYFLILSGGFGVFILDRAYTTQGVSAVVTNLWRGYSSMITPIACLAASPGYTKCWEEGRLMWGSLEGVYQVVVSCTSAMSDTPVSQTRVLSSSRQTRTSPESLRFVVPRNHARSTRLLPSVTITQAGANWRLEGLDIGYRVSSDRVLRKR